MVKQLKLDDALKDASRLAGPDGWVGNCFKHYGILYGIQIIPSSIRGEYIVRHVQVKKDEVENEPEN